MIASATRPMGRLTQKIQFQLRFCVSQPPSSGPRMAETPNTAPNRPWYLPRSRGENRSPMTASEMGKMAPAPTPWMPRKSTRLSMLQLRPDRNEPMRKIEIPMSSIGRRP